MKFMTEYPSIINSSKAPRKACVAFEKLDGSNIRVKWTMKQGFTLFGSRTQLIDSTHPHLGKVVGIFNEHFAPVLGPRFKKEFPNQREIIVFGEFLGKDTFAGIHNIDDPTLFFYLIDVMVGHKLRKFLKPKEYLKIVAGLPQAKVVYEGNMNDQLIQDVRNGVYSVNEGVVCKGTETSGAFAGGMWMCKIKTLAYLEKLKLKGMDLAKYGE